MDKQAEKIIEFLKENGASYGDIRIHLYDESESFQTLNGVLQEISSASSQGIGIRVLYEGAWGFASTEDFSNLESCAKAALKNAKIASGLIDLKIELAPKEIYQDSFSSPVGIDPFTVKSDEKIKLLLELDGTIKHERLSYWSVFATFYKKKILFFDTEGTRVERILHDINAGLIAFANDSHGKQQRRSHNLYLDADGTTGWECIVSDRLFLSHAARIKNELLDVIEAKKCPHQVCDLILLNEMMALQVHETIGHALELDRILCYELSYAGGSHVDLDDFGRLRYGSEKLNVRADGTVRNSPGSVGYDDDGVKAKNVVLIEKGILKSAITSRQMVMEANKKAGKVIFENSGGANRAASYNRLPIERMNNINVDPGDDGDLAQLIAGCENALLVESPVSWSIGSNRENFHFATEIGWEIRDGKIVRVIKNPSYGGRTVEFWNSLAKVGNSKTWQLQQVFNCGKGEPNQIMRLGHGVPVCLFKNVEVGI
ncbi:MAG: TldD/PmbA family protein [bacterium]